MGDLLWSEDIDIDIKSSKQIIGSNYGRLYSGYTSEDALFANTDWRIPTQAECLTLQTFVGGFAIGGQKLKEEGLSHWLNASSGIDEFNFSARGGGKREASTGVFSDLKEHSYIYCGSYVFVISYDVDSSYVTPTSKAFGYSNRLIWDGVGTPEDTITDLDGNIYDVVLIGTQYWLKQNWACTKLNDGTPITNVTDNTDWTNLILSDLAYCEYENDNSNVFAIEGSEIIGDFKSGDNTLSQVEDILLAAKGNFFWNPTLGYGAQKKINSNINPVVTQGEIINELKKEAIEYDDIIIDGSDIDLQINGKSIILSSE